MYKSFSIQELDLPTDQIIFIHLFPLYTVSNSKRVIIVPILTKMSYLQIGIRTYVNLFKTNITSNFKLSQCV